MKAEIIAVGTELLMGYVVNTNASDIARYLLDIGIGTYYQQVVGDNPERVIEALDLARSRSDLIILSGGIGPTRDDLTKQIVSDYLKVPLVEDPEQLQRIKDYLAIQNRTLASNQRREALTFKGGNTFINRVGLACGVGYEADDKFYIIVPGPPYEMRAMMEDSVQPYLESHLKQQQAIDSLYLNFSGIGESQLALEIDSWVVDQTNPTLAIYAKPNQVTIRLTANANTHEEAQELNQQLADQLIAQLSDYFIGYGEDRSLEDYIIEQLIDRQATLSVAESLTAGLVAESLAQVPGASEVLYGGFVTYQTKAKEHLLSIDSQLIDEYSVISPQISQAMAQSTLQQTETDYALGLTGVAGPGNYDEHPAGEIYISLAQQNGPTLTKKLQLPNRPRNIIRQNAKNHALLLLKEALHS